MESSYDISVIEKPAPSELPNKITFDSLPLSEDCEKYYSY